MSFLVMPRVRRWLRRDEPAGTSPDSATCQSCGASLSPTHQHLVDLASRAFVCVCRPCWLTLPIARDSVYRAIPENRARRADAVVSEHEWEEIQIPVGVAFFFRNSTLDAVVTCYPSPAGPVESQLPVGDAPWARRLAPDVEALLVRRTHRATESFVVPIDVAYELVGRVRRSWSGFGARAEVDRLLDEFFQQLERETEGVSV